MSVIIERQLVMNVLPYLLEVCEGFAMWGSGDDPSSWEVKEAGLSPEDIDEVDLVIALLDLSA